MQREAPLVLQQEREPVRELCFPGKIHATTNRVYVSDSGHNRVLEMTPHGRVVRVFGSHAQGLLDGDTEYAAFNNPQGLVRVDDYLFVADTDNHALRRISLRPGEVETVAGTGKIGRDADTHYDDPLQAALNSPWDVAYFGGVLYIAMAGHHQLWAWPLSGSVIKRFAGNGREDLVDGPALQACFAQPSGLSVGDHRLLVADAESSAVRSVRLPDGKTATLLGKGLFEFGDRDGPAAQAQLQHPLDIAHDEARTRLWICDTFNHQIRYLEYKSEVVSTLPCTLDLDEPGGISLCGDQLWVANTNQHQIAVYDIRTEQWRVMEVESQL